eukprot:scaffold63505_cov28-Tisochrysis_lutea.AAC.4
MGHLLCTANASSHARTAPFLCAPDAARWRRCDMRRLFCEARGASYAGASGVRCGVSAPIARGKESQAPTPRIKHRVRTRSPRNLLVGCSGSDGAPIPIPQCYIHIATRYAPATPAPAYRSRRP